MDEIRSDGSFVLLMIKGRPDEMITHSEVPSPVVHALLGLVDPAVGIVCHAIACMHVQPVRKHVREVQIEIKIEVDVGSNHIVEGICQWIMNQGGVA